MSALNTEKLATRNLFTLDVGHFITLCADMGYLLEFGEAYRDPKSHRVKSEGWKYIPRVGYWVKDDRAITDKQKRSQHQDRLAVDFKIIKINRSRMMDSDWRIVGELWESLDNHNRWGGRFGLKKEQYDMFIGEERNHFERADKPVR